MRADRCRSRARRGYPRPCHCASTSASDAAASEPTVGHRCIHPTQARAERLTVVWADITSATHTA